MTIRSDTARAEFLSDYGTDVDATCSAGRGDLHERICKSDLARRRVSCSCYESQLLGYGVISQRRPLRNWPPDTVVP